MKSHRGISSAVGAVFLIIVLTTGMTYVTSTMNSIGNLSEQMIVSEKRQENRQKESFEITSIEITPPLNKLDGYIKNTGNIPIEITRLWIDKQGINDEVQKIEINSAINPGNTAKLVDLFDYTIDPTKGYNLKFTTSRGSIEEIYVNTPSQENLLMQIRAIPEYVPSEFTTTILYSVINNMSNNNILYNITPKLTITDIEGSSVGTELSGPIPTSYPTLRPGETAVFEYSVQMNGNADDKSMFNATIANAVQNNWVSTTSTIKEVLYASEAGTSIEASELNNLQVVAKDILFFHDENTLTPNGEYHMDGSAPAGPGTTINPRNGDITFLTANVTTATDISAGDWNMRLSYWSELSPFGVPDPDMVFHFECNNCGGSDDTVESTGNFNDDFDKSGSVTWAASGGPDGDGSYTLGNSNDYLKNEWNPLDDYSGLTHISDEPATTAVWVKIPSTSDDYFPIIRWGDENQNDDEYEIALGDGGGISHGNIIFRYDTDKFSGEDETKCESSGYAYDDNQWHFLVAARDGDDDCKLYIDGVLADDTEECNGCEGTQSIGVDRNPGIFVGYDGDGEECKNCEFASFMHWDNLELDADDILELYYTNFGNNGTRLNWDVYKTDDDGVNIGPAIHSGVHELPFADPATHSTSGTRYNALTSNSTPEKHSFHNATFNIPVGPISLIAGERIKAVLSWPGDNQNLEINIRIDDDNPTYALPDPTSFIQTPNIDPVLPTFVVIDNDVNVLYTVFNNGPEGAWFTYQGTRFVVTLEGGIDSYAGIIKTVNGTGMSATEDSIYIPNQSIAILEFELLSNPPKKDPAVELLVPPGNYNAAVYLAGYDDMGDNFQRTINIGPVHITE